MYADILFQQKVGKDMDILTYEIPENLNVKIGQLVKVKIRNAITHGIIWNIHNKKPAFKTSEISEIGSETPLISDKQISLMSWMAEYYFCSLHKLLKLFVPKRILKNKEIKPRKKIEKENFTNPSKQLTDKQKEIVEKIINSKENRFLIHGITGSGKTEIYCHLVKHYLDTGFQAAILVPEISLTPQTIDYFENFLGVKSAVIHSKLSEGERYTHWKNIRDKKVLLIIGSRSTVFAPFQNLGIIIMDEEHETSYKQDNSPRYETHKVIEKIQELSPDIKIIFGSATPSVETAEKLKNSTFSIKERIGNSVLPEVEITDMREEFHRRNFSIFSERLQEEIKKALSKKEQIILFLNRRGSASSVVCRDCGFRVECKDCELPMTYHSKTLGEPSLICHHCGKFSKPPVVCPNCKGPNVRFLGIGTQRIEEDALKMFPQAKVLRADKDTTSTKEGFKEIYKKFKNHEADILIGTQMIAKGLDLQKVNLVGVILADIGLNIPDYRTNERNFELLTQVAGRSGRASTTGKVIIQTYSPENLTLKYAQTHNYDDFFKYEITQRKLLNYPPFSSLARIIVQNPSFNSCKTLTKNLEDSLLKIVKELKTEDIVEITSYPAYISKLRGRFQYIILIKDKSNTDQIHKTLEKLEKKYIMDLNIKIDIDPLNTT